MNTSLALDDSLSLQENFLAGQTLLINKPYEWTSFDVVNKIRYAIKVKKVGHAGTLDPLATGLLIVCTGKKTKTIESLTVDEKEYKGIIALGQTTPSYDLETELSEQKDVAHITVSEIQEVAKKFTGELEQTPPIYSALKVDGQRAYKAARKGLDIKMKTRQVVISEFEIEKIKLPEIHFRIVCSKGTYIRSIANDVGEALGVGAHLKSLQRTRSGAHKLEDAFQLDEFINIVKAAQ
jgi:tRNA pseudouridine55 synthase